MRLLKLFRLRCIHRFHSFIRFHYQKMRRRESFVLHQRTIHVKKGSRRYTLLVFENAHGTKLRFNIGRYQDYNIEDQIIPL